ncbi:hypothetical protein BDN67DRAFT_980673 [Paxillus ammoniavirescens]|nr:hypothetical protein BDN67DRAFT_980673 [Paxillus ammoniavirescens]
MSEYDDNIDDLPQKQQPQTATMTSYALTTTGTRKATSKFKPALGDITSGSEASHVTLRRKAAVASTSGLPVFSTPGFGKKPLSSASGPMSAPPLNREVLEIPSDDPPLDVAEHVPTKRIASELPEPAQGNSSKRFKSAASVHKENVPRKSPKGKARATSRHWTPDHREASSDIDCLNFGISHTKPPADPFKFARNFASSSTPIFARPRPPPALQPSPQKNASGDSSDLSSVIVLVISSYSSHTLLLAA